VKEGVVPSLKRRHWLLGTVLATIVIAGSATAAIGASSAKKDPIVIGVAYGKTGFISQFDIPPLNTARLAVEDINASGGLLGRPLKLVTYDTQSKVDQVANAAIQALSKNAQLLVTSCDFDLGAPAAVEAQKRGVLAFSLCAGDTKFGPSGIGPLAYTVGTCGCSHGAVIAEYGFEKLHLKSAYILTDPLLDYHKQMVAAFKARWQQLGGKLLGEDTYQAQDPSIATQITRIKALPQQPDFIFLADFLPSVATAFRQLRASGINVPILSGGENFDGNFWKTSVPNASNIYFSALTSVFGDDPNPAVNKMYVRYKREFHSAPTSGLAAAGYTMIQAWARAVRSAGTINGAAVAKQLNKFRNVPTIVGPLSFTAKSHIVIKRETRIMEIQNGKTRFVTLWTPKAVLLPKT
jgi:branched-chain amino acid transport system substrate-binding protein